MLNTYFVFAILTVFGIGCLIGIIPIIQNFPYPVGYDSINYYLPTLYDLNSSHIIGGNLFPVYVFLVYSFHLISFSDLYLAFNAINIVLYGSLSVTIYLLVHSVLRQSIFKSILFAIFVILQLSTLRMAWDLHRDILALICLNLSLIALNHLRTIHFNRPLLSNYIAVSILYLVTLFSDRMMGVLLIISAIFFSIRYKLILLGIINLSLLTLFISYFFLLDDITFVSMGSNLLDTLVNPVYNKNSMSPYDLLVLQLSLYGILIPFFIVGFFKKSNSLILKIPTLVTILLSFSWILIPNHSYLVPERWIILSGLFISIFGLYGFFLIVDRLLNSKLKNLVSILFISSFIIYGILFIVLPYGIVFTIPSLFQTQTGLTIPLSMSFNSLEISKNQDLVKSINWINTNTKNNSEIIGTMHWRGWFHLFLEKPRQYLFSETVSLPSNYSTIGKNGTALYDNRQSNVDVKCVKGEGYVNTSSFSESKRNIYLIDFESTHYDLYYYYPIVHHSKYFNIYEITDLVCR